MRQVFRAGLSLLLALVLILGCVPALAAEAEEAAEAAASTDGVKLLLQVGSARAVLNGQTASLENAPQYFTNGAILVPLRFVADTLGAQVSWDGAAKRTVLTYGDTQLSFGRDSWNCMANQVRVGMSAPARIENDTFYIPLAALTLLPGVYVHTYGYYDGGFAVVRSAPLTDADLPACREEALKAFGPNAGLLERTALQLRSDSRYAYYGGEQKELCKKGGTLTPGQAADGSAMVPLEFCAKALGGTYTQGANGPTVTYGGRTAVFSANAVTVDGVGRTCQTQTKDGVWYGALPAFTQALGLYGYVDAASGGILISPYDLSARQDLQKQVWNRVSQWALKSDEDVKGYIALTFDDGPSGPLSARLLDGLKARGAHATFFLCSYRIATFPQTMPRYLQEGHEVGSHGANHVMLSDCGSEKLASELDQANAAILKRAGVQPVLMRPPGGDYNKTVLSALADRGMSCIMWSLDPLDWKYRNKDTVVRNILAQVKDGDIVLLHDLYATSVDAALSVIDTLQAQGYRFVTVSELARIKGVTLQPGAVYTHLK